MRYAFPLLFLAAISGCRTPQTTRPLDALRSAYPQVIWDTLSVRADLNCDSLPDEARIGHYKGHIFVGFTFADAKEPDILEFAVAGGIQQAICGEPATLTTESQDFSPSASDERGELPGFRRSAWCVGLRLAGGECDSVHIYWNHDAKQITWWRL